MRHACLSLQLSSIPLLLAMTGLCRANDELKSDSPSKEQMRQRALVRYAFTGVQLAAIEYDAAMSLVQTRDNAHTQRQLSKCKGRLSQAAQDLTDADEGIPLFFNVTDVDVRFAEAQFKVVQAEIDAATTCGRRHATLTRDELKRLELRLQHARLKVEALKMHQANAIE